MVSTGIDPETGVMLVGWNHVTRCVRRIYATRIGSRVMRRQFGGGVAELIGRRMDPRVIALFRLLVVLSLERWEPRVKVRSIAFFGDVDSVRSGMFGLRVAVDYLPRGHLGDPTVADQRDIDLE